MGLLERLVLLHVEVDDGGGPDEQQEAQRFPREPTPAGSKEINIVNFSYFEHSKVDQAVDQNEKASVQ